MNRISSLLLLFALLVPTLHADELPPAYAFYEIRTYHAHEGKREALHARFRDHTCALFKKHHMGNILYLDPIENEGNTLTYLLGYHSKKQRDTSWKAFRDDPIWKKAFKASRTDGALVAKVDSTFFVPTDYSPKFSIIMRPSKDADRLFEIRTYTTNEGKLKDLDARFRDHTCRLFETHGIGNVIYLHPAEGQEGHGTVLKYIVVHKDMEARKASFKGFSKDPAWKAARDASEANGKIIAKDGIENTFFKATDYSPVK